MQNMDINLIEHEIAKTFDTLRNVLASETFFCGRLAHFHNGEYNLIFNALQAYDYYTDQDSDKHGNTVYLDLLEDPPLERIKTPTPYETLSHTDILKIQAVYESYSCRLFDLIKQISQQQSWDKLIKGTSIDFVYNDFYNFLHYFSYQKWANDETAYSHFLTEQFKVYQLGGVPCGWEKQYPQGNLIVYLPIYGERLILIKKLLFIIHSVSGSLKPFPK